MSVEQIAEAAHEMNRLWCCSVGDYSQPKWLDAPDWQRESSIIGVHGILSNPLMTPRESHEAWLECKRRDGWVHGVTKQPELRKHPCMVAYDDLPAHHRAKDLIFTRMVKTLIAANQLVSVDEVA